jgi:hypothetical protein
MVLNENPLGEEILFKRYAPFYSESTVFESTLGQRVFLHAGSNYPAKARPMKREMCHASMYLYGVSPSV